MAELESVELAAELESAELESAGSAELAAGPVAVTGSEPAVDPALPADEEAMILASHPEDLIHRIEANRESGYSAFVRRALEVMATHTWRQSPNSSGGRWVPRDGGGRKKAAKPEGAAVGTELAKARATPPARAEAVTARAVRARPSRSTRAARAEAGTPADRAASDLSASERRKARQYRELQAVVARAREAGALALVHRPGGDLFARVGERIWRIDGDEFRDWLYGEHEAQFARAGAVYLWPGEDCLKQLLRRLRRDARQQASETLPEGGALVALIVAQAMSAQGRTDWQLVSPQEAFEELTAFGEAGGLLPGDPRDRARVWGKSARSWIWRLRQAATGGDLARAEITLRVTTSGDGHTY